jgi:molecular chaperone GrpE (heat shock protein)
LSDDAGESVRWASLVERLDELTRELRRQGRAAVAAQAASESCLEQIATLELRMRGERDGDGEGCTKVPGDEHGDDEDTRAPDKEDDSKREDEARAHEAAAWLEALVPVADAIDRAASQAAEVAERARRPAPLRIWPFARKTAAFADLDALASGLRVLRDQLAAALASRGVRIERRVGIEVDPELHRVVAVRPPASGQPEREGTVLEVIRPGYAVGRRVAREADVVAIGGPLRRVVKTHDAIGGERES